MNYNKDLKLYEIKYKGYTFPRSNKRQLLRHIQTDTYRQCVKLWNIK